MRTWPALALALLLAPGCGRERGPTREERAAPVEQVVPPELLQDSWPLRFADDALRAPYEAERAWALLFVQRDPAAVLELASSPEARARAELELAVVYRQAALLAARTTEVLYGELRREEDPPGADCLLGFARLLLGEREAGVRALEACEQPGDEGLRRSRDAWLAWARAGAAWPPTDALAATPGVPGTGSEDPLPRGGPLPHYHLVDSVEGRDVPAAHPAALLGLSLYHEQRARELLPGAGEALSALLDPWRLPLEPRSELPAELELPDALLFGSSLLSAGDARAAAALSSTGAGPGAQEGSPLAAAVAPCFSGEEVDVDCVSTRALELQRQLAQALEQRAGGQRPYQPAFVAPARCGAVRLAVQAALAAGQERAADLLRLRLLDLSTGVCAEPAVLLSIAAWDAGNRNALRASDLLHAQAPRFPGLDAARYPLDALQLRIGRESAPGIPMH